MTKQRIFLFTGPVQTGKTTSLVNWSEKRTDVFGILTPVVDGKRIFMNVSRRDQFPMEAVNNETEILTVGRFSFSKTNFNRAIQIIRDASREKGWLIIDEIGPLELKGEGFCAVLKEILQEPKEEQKILLVVREVLAEKVIEYFSIISPVLVRTVSALPY